MKTILRGGGNGGEPEAHAVISGGQIERQARRRRGVGAIQACGTAAVLHTWNGNSVAPF